MQRYGWIAVAGAAVLLLTPVLVAQMDQNEQPGAMTPGETQTAPVPTGATGGVLPEQPGSMRESLGAPGLTGRQMADKEFLRTATTEGIADVKLGQLASEKGSPANPACPFFSFGRGVPMAPPRGCLTDARQPLPGGRGSVTVLRVCSRLGIVMK